MKSFTIEPTPAAMAEAPSMVSLLVALSRDGDRQLRYEIAVPEAGQGSFKPMLVGTPPMSPEDLVAEVFHDAGFSTLPPADQDGVRRRIPWFSFSTPQ